MEQLSPYAVPVPVLVAIGTYTATNGSDQLVGSGTKVTAGQRLFLTNSAGFIGIVGSDNNGTNILLAAQWGGPTGTGTLYACSETINDEVEEFYSRTNQVGTLAQRAAYDSQAEGYTYLVVDAPATFYGRFGASGTWFNVATNTFIYVDATLGSDVDGTGDIDLPVQTINAAIALAQAADDMTGQTLYIVLRAGTYSNPVNLKDVKGALTNLIICGETALGGTLNLAAVIVRSLTAADASISAINLKSCWTLIGFTVGSPSAKGHGILAKAARLRFNQLNFARTTGAHIACLANGNIALSERPGNNGYAIGDIANAHWMVNGSGATIDIQAETTTKPVITISGALTFATAFAWARASGQIFTGTGINFVNKQNVTGRRWRAEQNCSIDSGQSGEKYLPGTVAGIAVKNGEYL